MAEPTRGTAHNVLRYERNPLDTIFAPQSVAVIGATEREGSVGRTIVWNLISNSFGGVIFPVNPKRSSILGIKAYPDVQSIPDQVDLAVIVTPAATVPGIIRDCVEVGVKGAIIISAGFKETGPAGQALEDEVMAEAGKGDMRIIGPNCLGVMSPISGLNATFAAAMARPGNVGFISQSGALCTAILDWSFRENVGFSHFVSIGSMLDVGWGDLITYLGDDARTKSIVIYMETIGDARSFLSAAREVALTKPIIVIKPGRTEAAAKAAASHTGSLTGSDEVLRAAFRRSGVLRVETIDGLFNMAEVLAKQPRPSGDRLTIITNAGGPGVIATDALIASGSRLADLSDEMMRKLNDILPPHWSHNNPIDVLGDAGPDRYRDVIELMANSADSDGLMIILTPQAMTAPTQTAQMLKKLYQRPDFPRRKPILASWMGGADVASGESILNQANISTYAYPDTAARVFNYMYRYTHRLQSLYETPELPEGLATNGGRQTQIGEMIDQIRQSGRTILTEYESKQMMAAYGINTVETRLAQSVAEAVAQAEEIGYPVVIKLNSETITHKTDVGGVQLNLATAVDVRHAFAAMQASVEATYGAEHFLGVTVQPMVDLDDGYELIIGSSPDPQFGPVLLFGAGGTLVEVFKDRELGLPPLTTTLARRMMERTKIYEALQGIRGRDPVDLAALEKLMVRFSYLVVEQPWIKEIDINPLLASARQLLALDARVVLYGPEVTDAEKPELAIRPYPQQYIISFTARDGSDVTIRPIRPEDEPKIVNFHQSLSEHSVYLRYFRSFHLDQRVQHERMTRICFVDYDRDMALVAEWLNPETGEEEIIAVGRLSRLHNGRDGEFALLVSDASQGKGLGTEMLRLLLKIGGNEGMRRVIAYMLGENRGMRRICKRLGFEFEREGELFKAAIELS